LALCDAVFAPKRPEGRNALHFIERAPGPFRQPWNSLPAAGI